MAIYAIVAVFAYLLGSIPFGYILVRLFRGGDIRTTGSGNIGATNVARSGAPGLALLTLLLDAAKGFFAVLIALFFASRPTLLHGPLPDSAGPAHLNVSLITALAALFAIVGHIFPVWLRFHGGKGVATGVGSFLALAPKAVLVVLLLFAAIVMLFRYVSLGSIIAAALFPLVAYAMYRNTAPFPDSALAAMAAASLLIIVKHHANIRRLLAGTEHRLHFRGSDTGGKP